MPTASHISGLRSRVGRSQTLSRSITATRVWLKTQFWLWPVLAAFLLCGVAFGVRSLVEGALQQSLADDLTAILRADVTALKLWLKSQEADATAAANEAATKALVLRLASTGAGKDASTGALLTAPEQSDLRRELAGVLQSGNYAGFLVVLPTGRVVAADKDELVGQSDLIKQKGAIEKALAGTATVTRPAKSVAVLKVDAGPARAGVPTMFALAPVRDDAGKVAAVLALRLRPEAEFTQILSVGSFGKTGQTYAFDEGGLFLSRSRFDDQLKTIGLVPDDEFTTSVLALQMRNPGVDMTAGGRPAQRRHEQPTTKPAAFAPALAAGETGFDVSGYLDYRGVTSVGAWTWLPEYGFGVVTEAETQEAFHALTLIRRAFWGLFALLAMASLAIFAFTMLVARANRSARQAAVAAKKLGQYHLEEKLGSGGMGTVYKARHAMLRRPTAIKMLDPDKTTDDAVARFEREVQLTSQLTHPNTVAIYDYGRTPEGVFFYAMEYLDGLNLDQLVREEGPQPEGRVVRILTQICGSLAEAHAVGLIHRDIKPANILISRRGGVPDLVKLLDFGLVKAVDTAKQASLTAVGTAAGTPLYMSPESIERPDAVDARADLYAVGAVGYFLLTGTPVFEGQSVVEVCMKQVKEPPQRPSERLGRSVSEELEAVLLACLAKAPADRIQSSKELMRRLKAVFAGSWGDADADAWWDRRTGIKAPAAETASAVYERTLIVK